MSVPLRLLVIDDSAEDAELLVRHLRREGWVIEHDRVDTRASLVETLRDRPWDLIICDYSMPGFDPLAALATLRELALDIPVLIVSGTVGEEKAVACMRAGAHDFVLKDNLARLSPAIRRELEEAEVRRRLRASEAALLQSLKLRALGQMAAGVAHDLRNILHPLALNLQLGERMLDHGNHAGVREVLAEARQIVARGVQTVERLRDYGRQDPEGAAEPVDLDALALEALDIARPRLTTTRRACRVSTELGRGPVALAQASEIVNALVNLVVNAIDAMPDGGTVTLRSGHGDDGGWVEVQDDGPGMPPEVRARVFEPFFTTKGDGGTGLGLAMVYACMQRHGGRVTLETEVGRGTTFRLWFPPVPALRPRSR